MPAISWDVEEDIALCESWVVVVTNHGSRLQMAPFWDHVYHEFCLRRAEAIQSVDALCSRFQMIHRDCARFEEIVNNVDNNDGKLNEGDIIQIACL
ncbi:hypothetical protein Hanom_Chr00s001031g01672381 [Helianthus anomalus]